MAIHIITIGKWTLFAIKYSSERDSALNVFEEKGRKGKAEDEPGKGRVIGMGLLY